MLRIAGQTAGPIGLKFFSRHSWVVGGGGGLAKKNRKFLLKSFFQFFFHGQRRALQLVLYNKTRHSYIQGVPHHIRP